METYYRQLTIPVLCEDGIWFQMFHQSRSSYSTLMLMTSCKHQLEVKPWSC
jgi:hypothetical protein